MKRFDIRSMILCALFAALIAVGAFIRIDIPMLPFTLQVLFTTLAGLVLGPVKGMVACLVYMALGLIGLPIFTGGGGPAYVLHPTFGYLIGFAAGTYVCGRIAWKKEKPSYARLLAASFSGLGITYFFGIVYYFLIANYYLDNPMSIGTAFLVLFLPVLPGNTVEMFAAAAISKRVTPMYRATLPAPDPKRLAEKIVKGKKLSQETANRLVNTNLDQLMQAADFVRKRKMGDTLEFCAIINGKSGGCSEDCAFCAQSRYGNGERYPLLEQKELVRQAEYYRDQGIGRTSIVTAGKRLNEREMQMLEQVYQKIKGIALCASHGLLNQEELKRLKEAGVVRYHCNLETSRSFFPKICTTHTFDQKFETIRAAKKAGLSLCSGLLIGMGETIYDRIDAAFILRELGAESVPVNILVPMEGTPLEKQAPLSYEEILRTIAILRLILPDAAIRLAGGRANLPDQGKRAFHAGANAAITAALLTTPGSNIGEDRRLAEECGFIAGSFVSCDKRAQTREGSNG